MPLPFFKGLGQQFQLLQSQWAQALNPLLVNPLTLGLQLQPVSLAATTPLTINHLLGRVQQGYFITSQNASANIWQTQPFNNKTLTLEASAIVTISLWVY